MAPPRKLEGRAVLAILMQPTFWEYRPSNDSIGSSRSIRPRKELLYECWFTEGSRNHVISISEIETTQAGGDDSLEMSVLWFQVTPKIKLTRILTQLVCGFVFGCSMVVYVITGKMVNCKTNDGRIQPGTAQKFQFGLCEGGRDIKQPRATSAVPQLLLLLWLFQWLDSASLLASSLRRLTKPWIANHVLANAAIYNRHCDVADSYCIGVLAHSDRSAKSSQCCDSIV